MTISARRNLTVKLILASFCGAATALPHHGEAQGVNGAARSDNAFSDAIARPPEPPRCIHRAIDGHPGTNADDNRLTVWLSVREPTTATIKANGTAIGTGIGTFAITVMRDGIPIAYSAKGRGIDAISVGTGASVSLVPGRQYKITAKPVITQKILEQLHMDIGVGRICP